MVKRAKRKSRERPRALRSYSSVQNSFVPVLELLDDLVVLERTIAGEAREDFLAILEIGATNYTLKSEEEQEAIIVGFRALLRALRFPIQILVCSQQMDLSSYRDSLLMTPTGEALHPLALAHQADIDQLAARRTLIERRFYLIIPSWGVKRASWKEKLPVMGTRHEKERRVHQLREARQVLAGRVSNLMQQLLGMGLSARRLQMQELTEVFYRSLRGSSHAIRYPLSQALVDAVGRLSQVRGRKKDRSWQKIADEVKGDVGGDYEQEAMPPVSFLPLADLLSPESIEVYADALRVGEEYLRGLALVGYPREVVDGWLTALLQLDEVFDFAMHVSPQENAAVLRHLMLLKAQYTSTQKMNQRQGQQPDPTIVVAEEDIDDLMGQIASGEESLVEVSCYVLARAGSRQALAERTTRLQNTISNLLVSVHPTTLEHDEAFRACLPLCHDPLVRSTSLSCSVVASMFPFISDSLRMPGGVFVGVTPTGEPILLDPFSLDNPHEFWGGMTGGGKSYAIKLRIIHELLRDRTLQVIVIVPNPEYAPLSDVSQGQHVRMAPGSDHCINPFDLIPRGTDMVTYMREAKGDRLADKVQKLHVLLDLMLSDYIPSPTMLSAREKALLDRAFYEVYRRVGITPDQRTHDREAPLMRDLYEILRKGTVGSDEFGLADRLERFVEGSLSGLFARPTNLALHARLINFDLEGMRGAPELRPIGIFLIAEYVWTQALSKPHARRLYIDEAWSLVEHQEGGRFLERMARESRKYYLSLVTITQNPDQFIANPYGNVIAQNALTKVLKRVDTAGARAACESFGLTAEEERRLRNLQKHQALFIVGNKRMIVDIHANALEHELITTKPDEVYPQTPSVVEADLLPSPEEERADNLQKIYPIWQGGGKSYDSRPEQNEAGFAPFTEVVIVDSDTQEPDSREQEEPPPGVGLTEFFGELESLSRAPEKQLQHEDPGSIGSFSAGRNTARLELLGPGRSSSFTTPKNSEKPKQEEPPPGVAVSPDAKDTPDEIFAVPPPTKTGNGVEEQFSLPPTEMDGAATELPQKHVSSKRGKKRKKGREKIKGGPEERSEPQIEKEEPVKREERKE